MQCTVSLAMSFCSFVKDNLSVDRMKRKKFTLFFYFINRNRKLLHLLELLNFTYTEFITLLLLIEAREKSNACIPFEIVKLINKVQIEIDNIYLGVIKFS